MGFVTYRGIMLLKMKYIVKSCREMLFPLTELVIVLGKAAFHSVCISGIARACLAELKRSRTYTNYLAFSNSVLNIF